MTSRSQAVNARLHALAWASLVLCAGASAQTQVVKPPIAQYWMDVATLSMAGMDDLPDMGALGGLLGKMGGAPGMGANFGATRGMMPGRWLDLAVYTRNKPQGTQATQGIPPGQAMGATLELLPGQQERPGGRMPGGSVDEAPERPKGRILFYWGCSDTVRVGQPRILDFSKAGVEDYGKFMMGRAVRDTGAKASPGHAIWPNDQHRQRVPPNASLTGQHSVSGEGLPDGLRFTITGDQDFMPRLALRTSGGGKDATSIDWDALPTARAYFLNAMSGSDNAGQTEMVIWSSSELPDPGWGLMDYASNGNVAQWLRDKVLLPPSQTRCAIPAGIFARAEGAMLRGIAYGQELNLAHPPRPEDKRIAWEPDWAVKVRVKSMSMVPLGEHVAARAAPGDNATPAQEPQAEQKSMPIPGLPDVGKALKGLFGK